MELSAGTRDALHGAGTIGGETEQRMINSVFTFIGALDLRSEKSSDKPARYITFPTDSERQERKSNSEKPGRRDLIYG